MLYRGEMFYSGDVLPDGIVTRAVVTSHRIAIDWTESDWKAGLSAASSDGISFQGVFRYQDDLEDVRFELQRFDSKQDVMLWGKWQQLSSGNTGTWTIILKPDQPKSEAT